MSDDSGKSKKLSLSGGGKLTLGGIEAGAMRSSTPGAGRRTVQVEVRRKRAPAAPHRAATPRPNLSPHRRSRRRLRRPRRMLTTV